MSNARSKVLTVTVDKTVYNSLKILIADGKVSEFVNQAVEKELNSEEEKLRQQLIASHKRVAKNQKLKKELEV